MNRKQIKTQDNIQNNGKPGHLIPSSIQHLPQQSTAVLCRCQECGIWWGSSQQFSLQDFQVFRVAEPHTDLFLWEDYRGWVNGTEADSCPECGEKV